MYTAVSTLITDLRLILKVRTTTERTGEIDEDKNKNKITGVEKIKNGKGKK
jgi:hypothetical protein